MQCPSCKEINKDKVIDSRLSEGGKAIRRRRECGACGKRYTTKERVEQEAKLTVIKKDASRVPFDIERLLKGMGHACYKRPISQDVLQKEAESIEPSQLQARLESGEAPVVIDVRTPEEYAAGHIPGAQNIPFDQVAERISEVDAPHGVALYCMVGPRARKGEAALLASGYETVLHIEGGLAGWEASGLPVEREP